MATNGAEGGWRLVNGLALGVALGLGLAHLGGPPQAAAQQAGGQQMFAVVGAGQGQGSNVLFVIDPTAARLMVYEHRVGGRLELVTVRNMQYEARFEQWPGAKDGRATIPPVEDIQKAVQQRGG